MQISRIASSNWESYRQMSSMKRLLGKPEESAEWEEQHLGYQPLQAASYQTFSWDNKMDKRGDRSSLPCREGFTPNSAPRDYTLSGKKKAETKIIHEHRTSTRSRKAWVYQVLHQARAQAVQRYP